MTSTTALPARRASALTLAAFLALAFAVAAAGGLATSSSVATWYPMLRKPAWNPPAWVFGPVWSALYVAMSIAAWRVWRRRGVGDLALCLYFAQLTANLAWSFCFFLARSPLAGLLDIVALLGLLVATTAAFFRVDRVAGWLLVPYVAWVSFAAAFNAAIWRLQG